MLSILGISLPNFYWSLLFGWYALFMLLALLIILIILWILGYIPISLFPVPNVTLFAINGYPITLWNFLIFLVIVSLIGILPRPFREIAGVLGIVWILSILGIFLFNFSSGIVAVIIIGLIILLFAGI